MEDEAQLAELKATPTVPDPAKARYVMVGGFLGAGKTSALAQLAQWFSVKGQRVGLITNDQGTHLVDTAMLASRGFPVQEIPGGCFCCRFNSLIEAARRLTAESKPDVFVAEPVGSCTDLVATVTYPLRKLYGDDFTIAPLSVMVDPIRAMRILGLQSGGRFSDKVLYIYKKQLEEADLLVINKTDLLTSEQLTVLRGALGTRYPTARIFEVSARNGTGLQPWFEYILTTTQQPRSIMELDYTVYADGEALLGWLNCTLKLTATAPLDGNEFVRALAGRIQEGLAAAGAEVAHLKMTLDSENGLGDLAVINLVRNDYIPELSQTLQDPFISGELTVNLRAEATPEVLEDAVEKAVTVCLQKTPGLRAERQHLEAFRPGKPQPTHRLQILP